MNIRSKWKRLVILGIVWFVAVFPIPILPFLGIDIRPESIQTIVIIMTIITIPFVIVGIFMK